MKPVPARKAGHHSARAVVPLDAGSVLTDLQEALHRGASGPAVKSHVKRVVAQAGLSRDTALPCQPEVARFLKRLGWVGPHAQLSRISKAYADFIAEAARSHGMGALASSLYLRLHAGGGLIEGLLPVCGETPECSRCPSFAYCAHASKSGETADELHRRKEALESGRGEELADEDLLAILWQGGAVEPSAVVTARQLLARAENQPARPDHGSGDPPEELSIAALEAIAQGRQPEDLAGAGLRGLLALDALELRRRVGGNEDDRLRLLAGAEICRRWARGKMQTGRPILKAKDLFEVFHLLLRDSTRENFYVGLLDNKHRLFQALRISEGTINTAPIHPREAFAPAVRAQATAVVFIHNHPSGDPAPSREDIAVTKRLKQASELLGIAVLDHVIIGDGRYFSFAEAGKL
ncbi:MAG TPA: DNA repair protein RadC [Planctomycetota bacterium]|nr:DNA repair protein RadC [Planctomycetota bacterium]